MSHGELEHCLTTDCQAQQSSTRDFFLQDLLANIEEELLLLSEHSTFNYELGNIQLTMRTLFSPHKRQSQDLS